MRLFLKHSLKIFSGQGFLLALVLVLLLIRYRPPRKGVLPRRCFRTIFVGPRGPQSCSSEKKLIWCTVENVEHFFVRFFCGHFSLEIEGRKICEKFRQNFRRMFFADLFDKHFARTSLWGIAGRKILTHCRRLFDAFWKRIPLSPTV